MCCEGLPTSFYSLYRSVPVGNKYGNIENHLRVDKNELHAKTEAGWRRNGADRPCCSAGPRVSPLALPFVLDTAKWAANLCMSVPGLCSSIFFIKWAHFEGETWDGIICVFSLCSLVFSSYFTSGCLQIIIYQSSWNSLELSPTTKFGD